MPKLVKIIIIGAGDRGFAYADYAKKHPDLVSIVGVAEPRDHYRDKMAAEHNIPTESCFKCWREVLSRDKFSDGVIIATQDSLHAAPAIAFAEKGYHMLLEKPMAPNERDCKMIAEVVSKTGIIFGVCHVLRYTNYTKKLKAIIDSGRIGDVINIQHLEPVGYYHQAHSFVRGNWRRECDSTFMLLSKCSHDMDWIRYLMGCGCQSVSSFGSLCYFKPENRPPDAADRCLDCSIEQTCAYSAKKIYLKRVQEGSLKWPVNVITSELSEKGVVEALKTGPYGRCVWACDNDVVDNQVVNMLFEGGKTASLTMTAFCDVTHRKTRIFGTKGRIEGNVDTIELYDFLSDETELIENDDTSGGHGGGDYYIMEHFAKALANNDPSSMLSGAQETLESHMMTFAAERARKTCSVITL
jgi:predicted dehydrogenase